MKVVAQCRRIVPYCRQVVRQWLTILSPIWHLKAYQQSRANRRCAGGKIGKAYAKSERFDDASLNFPSNCLITTPTARTIQYFCKCLLEINITSLYMYTRHPLRLHTYSNACIIRVHINLSLESLYLFKKTESKSVA